MLTKTPLSFPGSDKMAWLRDHTNHWTGVDWTGLDWTGLTKTSEKS